MIRKERIFNRTPEVEPYGNVVYWMSREQRVRDNPSLLHALDLSIETGGSIIVIFTLTDSYPGANLRHYDFMVRGLSLVRKELREKGIPFSLLIGDPKETISGFVRDHGIGTVVTDFDPLRIKQEWQQTVAKKTSAAVIEVDGHNIVPARYVSQKVEFGAYTLRPKIHRLLDTFLEEYPSIADADKISGMKNISDSDIYPEHLLDSLDLDTSVQPVTWIRPGEDSAGKVLQEFISEKLSGYADGRNDPNNKVISNLSPYLHFGQISSQRIAIEVIKNHPPDENRKAFLEELIVRKELSDNFCLYNPDYDNPEGFHEWARKTHKEHARDEREFLYSGEQLEKGETHDPLWNASQMEIVKRGKMHGYLRMYWAKKILEWTPNKETAMKMAIYLNDKYELDGRDPNGYTGIAWSIGGVHDRAWIERPVFGKIRYMNYNGAKRKFNIDNYIQYVEGL